jgi:hypothetical protein
MSLLTLKSREKSGCHFLTIANNLTNPLQGKYVSIIGYQNNSETDYYLQVGNKKNVKPLNFRTSRAHLFLYYDVIQQNFIFPSVMFNFTELNQSNFFIQVGSSPHKPTIQNGEIVFPNASDIFFQRGASGFDFCYRSLGDVELFHPASFSGLINYLN